MEIEIKEKNIKIAAELLETAYQQALNMILDKQGKWPDDLPWGWQENRHIIRTLLNKAIFFWTMEQRTEARDLFTNLLRSNPMDNIGARDFLLAILMEMSYPKFQEKFDRNGSYDQD